MTARAPRVRRTGVSSMTGFGRAARHAAGGSVTVELRSTNHRYLEIDVRLPGGLTGLQSRAVELIRGGVRRGRIEAAIMLQAPALERRRVTLDEPLLRHYHAALLELKGRFGLRGPVTVDHLLGLPHAVMVTEDRLAPEKAWEAIRPALLAAVRELEVSRRREGGRLAADIRAQVARIEQQARAITARLPKALAAERRRLKTQLRALLGARSAVSPSVLAQAAGLVRDADVHEELVRLDSHLRYVRQTLAAGGLMGKRLDFIAQELVREANTTGAKVDDAQAAHAVVEIKSCIEKIREQVQNLE